MTFKDGSTTIDKYECNNDQRIWKNAYIKREK